FLFVDGVGIGERDASVNPFARAQLPVLSELLGGIPFLDQPTLQSHRALCVPLDANLDVDGLPQSGTGQTTLFTGRNAPAHLGEHYGPYPDERLLALLRDNLFHRLNALGRHATFANAYPPIFFERIDRGSDRRSATAQAVGAAGLSYRTHADLQQGRAVSASLTNERWPHPASAPNVISAREAGRNLERLSRDFDLTLFEFFLTDVAGHRPARMSAVAILERLDEFVGGILENFDDGEALLLITSDHGNIEDERTRRHTRNPVPAIIVGAQRHEFARDLRSLVDVTPAIVRVLSEPKT
ncbi:MAG: alkaline phosphatase family protein, partial [Chloroflexi bacterium]|nr:alkaline phosphatase family protein [Chloroflexota bacterium]